MHRAKAGFPFDPPKIQQPCVGATLVVCFLKREDIGRWHCHLGSQHGMDTSRILATIAAPGAVDVPRHAIEAAKRSVSFHDSCASFFAFTPTFVRAVASFNRRPVAAIMSEATAPTGKSASSSDLS
jgi:hypothetical protein